jgi:8-oxo-dGDP phosphatase
VNTGPEVWQGEVKDTPHLHSVLARQDRVTGAVFSLVTERVDIAGHVVDRDVIRHPGAVAVVAVNDAREVLLVRQYRHPVAHLLWEVPAGLLDQDGETPQACAHRELLEEGGVIAERLDPLITLYSTPGGSDEVIHVFLARGIHPAPGGRVHTGEAEEADMPQAWLPLAHAADAVLEGRIHNSIAAASLLAANATIPL